MFKLLWFESAQTCGKDYWQSFVSYQAEFAYFSELIDTLLFLLKWTFCGRVCDIAFCY